jgi:hypothetical protein
MPDGLMSRCKVCNNAASAKWREVNGERAGHKQRQIKYNLLPDDYATLVARFNGQCHNRKCRAPMPAVGKRRHCVDHEHATSKVRGLLCLRCNTALGLLRESSPVIEGLAEYLESCRARNRNPSP